MTNYTELPSQQIELAKTDQAAFIELYQHYSQRVLRFLIVRTGNLPLAEDLAQETFLIVLTKLPSYQVTGAKFSSWLLQIALNCARMYFRKQSNAATTDLETIRELWPATADHHTDWMDFFQALHKLSDEDQTLLTLKYVEDYSNQDIASHLNISPNHCGVNIHRALQRLQAYL
jgi:RNA polymerase sigma-70 factor (ECF subfamily)